jgi:hypothetical protein
MVKRTPIKIRHDDMLPIEFYIESGTEPTFSEIKAYFNKWKNRGDFYCQMKKEACVYLYEKGYKYRDIALAVYGSDKRHDIVSWNLNKKKDIDDAQSVVDNWKEWIMLGKYPISRHVAVKRIPENKAEEKQAGADGYFVYNYTTFILS